MAKFKRYAPVLMTMLVAGLIIVFALFSNQVKPARASFGYDHVLDVWQRVWNEILQYTPAGQYYEVLVLKHGEEVQTLTSNDPVHLIRLWQVAEQFTPGLEAFLDGRGETVQITEEQIHALQAELEWLASVGSKSMQADIETELQRFPLEQLVGMNMDDALDYLNASVSPIPTPEPTPIAIVTITPAPVPVNQCMVGYYPDCLAEPSLVPGSDGQWAYYVLNRVYFEYPSAWRVEQYSNEPSIVSLLPTTDFPESLGEGALYLSAAQMPGVCEIPYDPMTYSQMTWGRPVPIWSNLVSLPDFEGSVFLWSDEWSKPFVYMESYFCDPRTHTDIGFIIALNNGPQNNSFLNLEQMQKFFPNYWRIMSSLRIGSPHQP
jgi:hypothetical protein